MEKEIRFYIIKIIQNFIIKGEFLYPKVFIIKLIETYGNMKMQDIIRNELIKEYTKWKKTPEENIIFSNIKKFEEILKNIFLEYKN